MTNPGLPALLQQFFTNRLCNQMQASSNTIAGYRDTFRLLLRFVSDRTGKVPTKLKVEDVGSELVGDFLAHIESERAIAHVVAIPALQPSGLSSGSWP